MAAPCIVHYNSEFSGLFVNFCNALHLILGILEKSKCCSNFKKPIACNVSIRPEQGLLSLLRTQPHRKSQSVVHISLLRSHQFILVPNLPLHGWFKLWNKRTRFFIWACVCIYSQVKSNALLNHPETWTLDLFNIFQFSAKWHEIANSKE